MCVRWIWAGSRRSRRGVRVEGAFVKGGGIVALDGGLEEDGLGRLAKPRAMVRSFVVVAGCG